MNNAKDYLMQIRLLDMRLKSVEQNIEAIRTERQSLGDVSLRSAWPDGQPHGTLTGDPTGTQAVRNADRFERKREQLAARLQQYETEQILLKAELWNKRVDIISVLNQVPDALCHRLLYLRYVECRRWEYIAVELNKSYQWVAGSLHSRGLIMVEEILKNENT